MTGAATLAPPARVAARETHRPRRRDLGECRSYHSFDWKNLSAYTAPAVICALVVLPILGVAVMMANDVDATTGTCVAVAIALLPWTAWAFRQSRLHKRDYVAVYDQGLTCRFVDDERVVRWEQIRATEMTPIRLNGHAYNMRLRLENGDGVSIPEHLTDRLHLIATLEKRVAAMLQPSYEAALGRGDAVRFGSLILSREGLTYASCTFPWHTIDCIALATKFGAYSIRVVQLDATPCIDLPLFLFPNLRLFWILAGRFATMR